MLDQATKGHGCVAGVVGPAGIGKSRILSELAAIATSRGVEVFSTYCESHTSDVPFYASTGLLRAAVGIEGLDASAARARVREQNRGADPADLVLLDDLLGIADPTVEVPEVAPEARRRRLAALVNAAVLARTTPAVFVIEDAHWIDETSESFLAGFLPVVSHTRSLMLITYRPEYRGALSQARGGQTIALAPLDDPQTAVLVAEQLGGHPSIAGLADQIVERAAGNPFFVEEIVRDLADRGVIVGRRGQSRETALLRYGAGSGRASSPIECRMMMQARPPCVLRRLVCCAPIPLGYGGAMPRHAFSSFRSCASRQGTKPLLRSA
jgi:predicted ATPase